MLELGVERRLQPVEVVARLDGCLLGVSGVRAWRLEVEERGRSVQSTLDPTQNKQALLSSERVASSKARTRNRDEGERTNSFVSVDPKLGHILLYELLQRLLHLHPLLLLLLLLSLSSPRNLARVEKGSDVGWDIVEERLAGDGVGRGEVVEKGRQCRQLALDGRNISLRGGPDGRGEAEKQS